MNRNLAMAIVLTLIPLVLYQQRRRLTFSPAMLIPLVWFFISASKPLSQWLSPTSSLLIDTEVDYLAGSPLDRNFLLALTVLGFLILVRRNMSLRSTMKRNPWLFVFLAYLLVTALWSRFPAITLKRYFKLCGDLIMVMIIGSEEDPLRSLLSLLKVLALILLPLSLVFIKYFREIGVSYTLDGLFEMWVGVSTQKNELAQLASFSLVTYLLCMLFDKKEIADLPNIIVILLAAYLLRGSSTSFSASSLVVLIAGIVNLVACYPVKRHPSAVPIAALYSAAIGLLILVIMSSMTIKGLGLERILLILGRDATLTGRVDLWNRLLEIASRHRLLGVGYGSFWIGSAGNDLWRTFLWRPNQGHNGYIDLYVELGLVGLILFIVVLFRAFRAAFAEMKQSFGSGLVRVTFLVMIVIQNITETSYARPTSLLWLLLLSASLSMPAASPAKSVLIEEQPPLQAELS